MLVWHRIIFVLPPVDSYTGGKAVIKTVPSHCMDLARGHLKLRVVQELDATASLSSREEWVSELGWKMCVASKEVDVGAEEVVSELISTMCKFDYLLLQLDVGGNVCIGKTIYLCCNCGVARRGYNTKKQNSLVQHKTLLLTAHSATCSVAALVDFRPFTRVFQYQRPCNRLCEGYTYYYVPVNNLYRPIPLIMTLTIQYLS